jgi:hypothetical protein
MNCWHCGATLEMIKLTFRASCEKCGSGLHCCQNCRFYMVGRANDCQIPGTDPVKDRTLNNYCDEFSALNQAKKEAPVTKKPFEDLFK